MSDPHVLPLHHYRPARRGAPVATLVASVLLLAGTAPFATGSAASKGLLGDDQAGRRVLMEARCQRCHAVSAADIAMEEGARVKGPDLAKLSSRMRKATELDAYLRRTSTKDEKRHPFPWRGEDEDLDRLIDWLLRHQASEEPRSSSMAGAPDP